MHIYKQLKAVRLQLTADVDEKLIQLMFYDNVKPLAALRETIYHYDLADEGSDGKKL